MNSRPRTPLPLPPARPAPARIRRTEVGVLSIKGVTLGTFRLEPIRSTEIRATDDVLPSTDRFQVRRAYAGSYTTEMVDLQPVRNRADEFYVGVSVGRANLSATEQAVSIRTRPALPYPTWAKFWTVFRHRALRINLGPETFINRAGSRLEGHQISPGDVPPVAETARGLPLFYHHNAILLAA